jgi:nicotinate-nucleotide--dimethylbenzimidazole phosphoribosyltransferase
MGKERLLDLRMRLGEGTGAALAAGIVKAAIAAHTGMATFEEAGVAGKD